VLRFLLTPGLVNASLLKPGVRTWPETLRRPPEGRRWTVEELAGLSEVSLGWVSAVKRRLLDFEYVREEDRRIILTKPGELLDEWARNYDPGLHHRIGLYVPNDLLSVVEGEVAREQAKEEFAKGIMNEPTLSTVGFDLKTGRDFPCVLTSFSGASYVAPFVRFVSVTAFFSGPIEEIKREFSAKEVPTGANLNILVPHDDGVYFCLRQIRQDYVVNAVQLYLDLFTDKGRGEEAAQAVRDQELKY